MKYCHETKTKRRSIQLKKKKMHVWNRSDFKIYFDLLNKLKLKEKGTLLLTRIEIMICVFLGCESQCDQTTNSSLTCVSRFS